MKRAPLYSRSRRPARAADRAVEAPAPASTAEAADGTRLAPQRHAVIVRLGGPFWAVCGALAVGAALLIQQAGFSPARQLSQADIDAAVRSSIEKQPLPSAYATAYAAIRPSVVKVIGSDSDSEEATGSAQRDSPEAVQRSTGTGVVIVENGTILTNLHVVSGSKRLRVVFADGLESEAVVVSTQPENDLAVLRARRIPDDLVAATLGSSSQLQPGDQVLAIGYPFGIGPSASGGIVSGLKREFQADDDGKRMTNLIQFDAAANPGNSGGPLIAMDGSVVGIVTAILNPGEAGTFIGIGFAVPIENAAGAAGMPPF
ncbi:MAG: trypsin-like peptidase domain-containing protein [Rhizobacter sp.]|nr:trypsin-like peptidase domain-containing protein [Rhizobacter sp.]MBP6270253.1 trypsin-like peptidase domain-containing protein [Rhizobacter sp.]HQX61215.1 trypsin-like peptidase domain-containing protein [Burkholderiaceae bacterium]